MSNATYDGIFLAPESIVVLPGMSASALDGSAESAQKDLEHVPGEAPHDVKAL